MSNARATVLPDALRRLLARFRRRQRLLRTLAGVFLTLCVFVACVGVAVAMDRVFRLPSSMRLVALALIATLSLFLLGRFVLKPVLQRMNWRRAAMRLGQRFPEMREDLVTAVELSDEHEDERGVSHSLIVSVVRGIAERARAIDHRLATPLKPILKFAALFVLFAGFFQAAYLARPEAILNALYRLFQPTKEVPYFCYTKLTVTPGDCVIRTGDSVTVNVVTSGRPADEGIIETRNGGDPVSIRLACEEGTATWSSSTLFEDLRYRISAGDALSPWYRVRVVPPPALRDRAATLRDPEYAGRHERIVESIQGPLDVVEGSEVVLRVRAVRRGDDEQLVCRAEMVFADQSCAMRRDGEGWLNSAPFVPKETGERAFRLIDGYGLANRSPESVFVRVVPDLVPKVTVAVPAHDVVVLPSEVVPVEVQAEDEFGMRGLSLAMTVRRDEKSEHPAAGVARRDLAEGGIDKASLSAKTDLDVAALGLLPGDILEYRAEASDYAGEALMRVGASATWRVTVISEAEHLDRTLARLRAIQIELMRRAALQKAEAAQVGEMSEDEKKRSIEKMRAAEERERELARSTRNLARSAEELIPELARNPLTSPKLMTEMEKLGRSIRAVADSPMTEASDELGKAGQPQEGEGEQQQGLRLKNAQISEEEAARQLDMLAKMVERMQRSAILEKLAAEAERLAARQRELRDRTVKTGLETGGYEPEDLPEELKAALQRLVSGEEDVRDGVKTLGRDIDEAAARLAHTKPEDAKTAERAGDKFRGDKVGETAEELVRRMERNVLFSETPTQERVAQSLTEIAAILRGKKDTDELEAIAKELDEFIRRQTEINSDIGVAIAEDAKAMKPAALGAKQSGLQQDVSEQAGAIEWLAREVQLFRSLTAAKLEEAAGEMKTGASYLYRSGLPEGLEHGKRALALLIEARKTFDQERQQIGEGCKCQVNMEALLLLQRILIGQQQLIKATGEVDRMPRADAAAFAERTAGLAGKQSRIRGDATRLAELLAQMPGAARIVNMAGEKMDFSRMALEAGDPGTETRVVQRQALALLEKLLGDCKGMCGGMGLQGMRMMAMMQMMGQGMSPGGNPFGGNAPILPASLEKVDDEGWRRTRSRFEGQLGASFEAEYPPEYRRLLDAYFDRLRKEPMR